MSSVKRRAYKSFRTTLMIWFLIFSIVPLAFITGYSIVKYEKAIDYELSKRLEGNGRSFDSLLVSNRDYFISQKEKYLNDPRIVYQLSTSDFRGLSNLSRLWLKTDLTDSFQFINRSGRIILGVEKDMKGEIKDLLPDPLEPQYLDEKIFNQVKALNEYFYVDVSQSRKISLICLSTVFGKNQKVVGFIKQGIDLNQKFVLKLKNRTKLEVLLLNQVGQVMLASHGDFYLYKKDFFNKHLGENSPYLDISIRGDPYGFLVYPLAWGKSDFYVAFGASKAEAKSVLKKVNMASYTVVGIVVLLLIIIIIIMSNAVLKPLEELVEATQRIRDSDQFFEIPVKTDNEIGLLTESFNEMSRHIIKARTELKNKIFELEKINNELTETQSRLLHSSKMISLGELVAGVAHELNNPIGFIYSNMSLLKEYSSKLLKLVDIAENNPSKISVTKKELEIDYIKEDLPKLVSSCEDGARRTRDIVIGLRNFSRLEKSEVNEINLQTILDNTLALLKGEIKNKIQVHLNYKQIPQIKGYLSQLNQVFMNILTNAIQAIEGTGNIWISTEYEANYKNSRYVKLSIQDSGKGISKENLDKIFDPFFSTKGVGQGTGLGLSISYGIIKNHGGDILVHSQLGLGSEFIIYLPLNPPDYIQNR